MVEIVAPGSFWAFLADPRYRDVAIVKFEAPVSGLRGTVGGVVYSANKSGPYCKRWASPPRPIREATAGQQGALGGMPAEWRAMSQALRDAWDVWAADADQELTNSLGEAYYVSGWCWFCKMNLHRLMVGRAVQTSVPTLAKPSSPSYTLILEETGGGANSRVTYTSGTFDPDLDLVLQVAMVSSQGRSVWPLPYPFIDSSQNPGATSHSFQTEIDEVYGRIVADQRGFAALYKQTSEGYRSAPGVEFEDVV